MRGSVRTIAIIAAFSAADLILGSTYASAVPIKKATKPATVTTQVSAAPPVTAIRTLVYIPTMSSEGRGYIAQFSMDDDGALSALKPPIVITGNFPYSVAVDPSRKHCYAALWTDPGALDQFTIRPDGTLVTGDLPRVRTGRQPYPITFTPDGSLAVIPNNEDGTISTYRVGDNGSMTIAGTVSSGKEARSVVVDQSGAFVYAGNYDSQSISVYALASSGDLAPISTVPTGELPYNVTLSPDGRYLYSADRGSGDVMIFAVSKGDGGLTLVGNAPSGAGGTSGANWIAFDSAGKFAYVTNYNEGTVSQFIVDDTSGHLTRNGPDVKVGSQPIQVAIDPSNQFVLVANSGDNTLSELYIRHDGTLSAGASVRLHGGPEMQVGGTLHLSGSPWTIAFAKK